MASLIQEIEGESLWHVLRHGTEKRKQAEQLEFAVARLEVFLREMQKTEMNYAALASIVVELTGITDTPFDLVGMLHSEMEQSMGAYSSWPTKEEVVEFFNEWADLFPEVNAPDFTLDDDFSGLALKYFGSVAYDIGQGTFSGDPEKQDKAKTFIEGKLDEVWALSVAKIANRSEFGRKWHKYPVTHWWNQTCLNSFLKGNHSFMVLETNFDDEPYKDSRWTLSQRLVFESPMAWVMVGEAMMSACSGSAQILDFQAAKTCHKENKVENLYKDLARVVVPNFLAKLIRLKSVLNSQAIQASQTQTKIVATAASGFVALSQATATYFNRSQSSCSCE